IVDGEFVRSTERWEPNYLVTPFNDRVSRVRVLATVVSEFVSEDKKYSTITLDDGSDTITVRAFKEECEMLGDIDVGDIVDVVGKVKEYQEERYITSESIWRLEDPNWELVRKLELLAVNARTPSAKEGDAAGVDVKIGEAAPEAAKAAAVVPEANAIEVVEEVVESESGGKSLETGPSKKAEESSDGADKGQKSSILKLIRDMDEGDGVKYVTLLKESGLTEDALEAVLNELMQDGDVYEPKIGRFKGV
ncbi:MAG: OB-fold nucleic acid binding domain-containing protein, partial [Candidatus Hydrothermarchaeaceae archaeon]